MIVRHIFGIMDQATDIKTLAGIVLLNPEIGRLRENIDAIKPQVDTLLLIENGSSDLSYNESLKDYEDIIYIKNGRNMGLAYALNQILGYAYSHGYKWALMMDQDSVASSNMIEEFIPLVADDVGMIGPMIEDRNFKRDQSWGIERGVIEMRWIISSASFTNVEAWMKCGGFDTDMFIDWVDWEIGESMHKAGYRILRTYKTKLLQELGHGTWLVKVRKHEMQIMNHSAFRYYHFFRNRLYMARKYSHISMWHMMYENCFQMYAILKYERNRLAKFWAFLRASVVGLFYPRVKYSFIKDEFLHM